MFLGILQTLLSSLLSVMMAKLVFMISAVLNAPSCRKCCLFIMDRVNGHSQECNVVSFNPFKEHLLMTGSSDMTAGLWDLRNMNHVVQSLEGHTDAIFSGVWSPHHPNHLATGGLDRRVIVWDLNKVR